MKSFLDEFAEIVSGKNTTEMVNILKCSLPHREKQKIVIREKFKQEYRNSNRSERDVILDLAAEFNIGQTTVWRIVKSCK
jgi:hypothetical protein